MPHTLLAGVPHTLSTLAGMLLPESRSSPSPEATPPGSTACHKGTREIDLVAPLGVQHSIGTDLRGGWEGEGQGIEVQRVQRISLAFKYSLLRFA